MFVASNRLYARAQVSRLTNHLRFESFRGANAAKLSRTAAEPLNRRPLMPEVCDESVPVPMFHSTGPRCFGGGSADFYPRIGTAHFISETGSDRLHRPESF